MRILVTVGSDHHPFDRLIQGVDRWAEANPEHPVTIQYGTAQAPVHGSARDFMPHAELMAELERADVLVAQGGPMGIVEARRHGVIPIVWPRLARFGEVVDDHQVDLCRHLAAQGEVVIVESEDELLAALDRAAEAPETLRTMPVDTAAAVRASVDTFAAEVGGLPPRRPLFGRRRPQRS